jgi:hypothetical protein
VHVHETARAELRVDLVERLDEPFVRRHREIADGHPDVTSGRRREVGIGVELAVLREIQEQRDACGGEVPYLGWSILRTSGARMTASDEPSRLDDGRRAHDATVCPPPGE